jgi:hypothetical protein
MTRISLTVFAAALALAAGTSCRRTASTAGLAVDLFLGRDTVGTQDTLSGTIRLRNTRLEWLTVEFPSSAQAELLACDSTGALVLRWSEVRYALLTELSLGPWCSRDFDFRFCPADFACVESLRPGTLRLRAKPADYDAPWTERQLVLTE